MFSDTLHRTSKYAKLFLFIYSLVPTQSNSWIDYQAEEVSYRKTFKVFWKASNNIDDRGRRNLHSVAKQIRSNFSRQVSVHGRHEKMGYFYTLINVGTPPQQFGVILDTGSTILSIPCENCSHCGSHLDPVFNITASSTAVNTKSIFRQSYTEGSSLHGTYVEDFICIGNCTVSDSLERLMFKFGCANVMTNLFRTQLADGIMGMANDSNTFLSQLMTKHRVENNVFTLCLAYEDGTFGIGNYSKKSHWSDIIWIPLSRHRKREKFYYIGVWPHHFLVLSLFQATKLLFFVVFFVFVNNCICQLTKVMHDFVSTYWYAS